MASIKVPKPRKLPSGNWNIYLDKEEVSVTKPTERECVMAATAIRLGYVKKEKSQPKLTLYDVCSNYIYSRDNVLSPATVRSYRNMRDTRFKNYMQKEVGKIDFQQMVNDESAIVSAKTVFNAWLFVASALKASKVEYPKIALPEIEEKDEAWLTGDEIKLFLNAVRGYSCEMAALLMLHSLRRSEVLAITPKSISDGFIHVRGAYVRGDSGMVYKPTNKSKKGRRDIPILIPRLEELIAESDCKPNEPYVTMNANRLYDRINEACDRAGVPRVGCHGLRRSFASLCASKEMRIPEDICAEWGGWSDYETMHKIYTKYSLKDRSEYVDKIRGFYTESV